MILILLFFLFFFCNNISRLLFVRVTDQLELWSLSTSYFGFTCTFFFFPFLYFPCWCYNFMSVRLVNSANNKNLKIWNLESCDAAFARMLYTHFLLFVLLFYVCAEFVSLGKSVYKNEIVYTETNCSCRDYISDNY